MRNYFGMAVLASVLLLVGCAGSALEGYIDIAKEKGGVSKEYLTVLKKWTRDGTVYSEFETKVRIVATYKSREFQEAYAREYSRVYSLTGSEKKRKSEALKGLTEDGLEFLFYAYIPDKTQNDFDRPDSIWTVFLVDEKGDRHYPSEVRRIEKVTPMLEEFYPYGNPYHGIYYNLVFKPISRGGKAQPDVKLVFAGVLGRIEHEWKGDSDGVRTDQTSK